MKMERPRVVMPPDRRGRGRPSVDGAADVADVHLTLPADEYDQVFQLAQRQHESVQAIIRRALKRLLVEERSGGM